ncbi:MAG: dienelactone hydrolase family protein [Caldilineaceae bacterium]|nr:dienelactone hydrolase family protein [Caldilineaceae bacterium]
MAEKQAGELGKFERYLVEEFYDDYREGSISRRTFIRRVAFITGSMAAASTAMLAVGCQPIEVPAATDPMPEAEETPTAQSEAEAEAGAVPGAQSPLSVPEGDPELTTEDVTFTSQDAEITAYLARPVAEGTYPAVMVCHENRGLTPHIRDVARRFAKQGYVAIAPDLLAREGGTDTLERDAVPGLLTDAGVERHVADFAAAFAYLQAQEFVEAERIGMNGYCFGGGITWQCATQLPLKAAAPFYGPAPDLDQVPNIQAAVLGVYAEQDERINAGIPDLEAALDAAGVTYEIKIYPGVNHAFHNDTGERYVEEQATQAWNDMLAWFEQYI